MTVANGQIANASTFNAAFISRTADTSTVGKLSLLNVATESGATVANIQRTVNAFASATGIPTSSVYNFLLSWSSDIVGSANDTVKARIEALVARFTATSSHSHNGVDGNGQKISAADLSSFNNYSAEWQTVLVEDVIGDDAIVTTELAGKTPGGGTSTAGVVTTGDANRVEIRDATTKKVFFDGDGNKIYGRLTESSSVWTLSFFVLDEGSEVAANLEEEVNIDVLYLEVFTAATRPTTPANDMLFAGAGGGGGGSANTVTSISITNGAQIPIDDSLGIQTVRLNSVSGAVTSDTEPFSFTPPDGAIIYLIGISDTDTVTIPYSDTNGGCLLNGDWQGLEGTTLSLMWVLADQRYYEIARR